MIEFADIPRADTSLRRNACAVRNLRTLAALAIVFPAMEGTPNRFSLDPAAFGKMGAEVRAVGVEYARDT